jgi:hypothetical protein
VRLEKSVNKRIPNLHSIPVIARIVGFKVLTELITKNAVFWDVAPRETDVSKESVASVFRGKGRWRRHVPPERRLIINPHGATSKRRHS